MIKAKFSSDPRVVDIQKSLLALWARRGGSAFGILAAVTGIDEQRIRDIATGEVEPDITELTILEVNR